MKGSKIIEDYKISAIQQGGLIQKTQTHMITQYISRMIVCEIHEVLLSLSVLCKVFAFFILRLSTLNTLKKIYIRILRERTTGMFRGLTYQTCTKSE